MIYIYIYIYIIYDPFVIPNQDSDNDYHEKIKCNYINNPFIIYKFNPYTSNHFCIKREIGIVDTEQFLCIIPNKESRIIFFNKLTFYFHTHNSYSSTIVECKPTEDMFYMIFQIHTYAQYIHYKLQKNIYLVL